jgi:hypothetical protein
LLAPGFYILVCVVYFVGACLAGEDFKEPSHFVVAEVSPAGEKRIQPSKRKNP